MKKRGQAALEFLTTYGWVILVLILVVGSLAALNVFKSPSTPSTCSIAGPFVCQDVVFREGGFEITLKGSRFLTGNVVSSETKVNNQVCNNIIIIDNALGNLNLRNNVNIIRCYSDINNVKENSNGNAEISISYTSEESNIPHKIKASLSGKVEKSSYANNFDSRKILGYDFENILNVASTSFVIDNSPYNNTGILFGGVLCSSSYGKKSVGCNFDSTDDYINIPKSVSLGTFNGADGLTMEIWIKFPGSAPSGTRLLIDHNGFIGLNTDLAIIYGTCSFVSNRIVARYGSTTSTDICNTYTSWLNNWHHLAFVLTSTGATSYIDGIATTSTNIPSFNYNTFNSVYIGRGRPPNTNYWSGYVDEIVIYNKTLSDQEIKDHYNKLK